MTKKKKLTRDEIDKDVKVITPAELSKHLLNAEYKFAHTMPEQHHYYTLKSTWSDPNAFMSCIKSIRVNGIQIQYAFNKRWYICFLAGGYRFFNICTSAKKGVLINRAVSLPDEKTKPLK